MNYYKILGKEFTLGDDYKIIPIRDCDKYLIMHWRNSQMYHLRQSFILTKEIQDQYFDETIKPQFSQEKPNQILFSFLYKNEIVGYGGLVHINWKDKNAEISFLINSSLEDAHFGEYWVEFLNLIQKTAFNYLKMHKIYTYAFNLRPYLYPILESFGFSREAILKDHSIINEKPVDVYIHSKINTFLNLYPADNDDIDITFSWINDKNIRMFSPNQNYVKFEAHKNWFLNKINAIDCYYYIFYVGGLKAGSIRIDFQDNNVGIISYLIDTKFQGKGYGYKIIELIEAKLLSKIIQVSFKLIGRVNINNKASIKVFKKLNYNMTQIDSEMLEFSKNFEL